ncbi:hypothetical protein DPEC_G00361350 [Dallia pectoralis]|uniref:Uncharacterized protein n=1 Tax=Dallia pectoralis TaxID=75939 RepID=A0ACC2F0Y4_DALPE|nr:hypothetical protein DPEC_G00361350 [Dallia pectoralis]
MTDTGPWSALRTGEDTDFSLAVLPQPKHRFGRNLTCTCPMMVHSVASGCLSPTSSRLENVTRMGGPARSPRLGSSRLAGLPLSGEVFCGGLNTTFHVQTGTSRRVSSGPPPRPIRPVTPPWGAAGGKTPLPAFPRRGSYGRIGPGAPRRPEKTLQVSPGLAARPPPRKLRPRPQIRRDNPLNLSILLAEEKKLTRIPSVAASEEGRAQRRIPVRPADAGNVAYRRPLLPASIWGLSPSDRGPARGWCEASNGPCRAGVQSSQSRVVWECSPKRVSARRIQPGGRFLPRCVRIPKRGSAPGFKFRRRAHFFRRRCAATVSGSAWKGGAKVATGLAAVSFTAPRPLLAVSRGRGQSARCVMLPAGSTGPRPRRDCRPVRTVPSAGPTASRRRVGTGSRKLASGVSGNVGNPPDPS